MSLDVTLYTVPKCPHCSGPLDRVEVFSANITHNLCHMAYAAGIYEVLWRAMDLPDPEAAAVAEDAWREGRHDEYNAIREGIRKPIARDIIDTLRMGVQKMRDDPQRFRQFNALNGWGVYDDFLPWLERYLAALEQYPDAEIEVSR